MTNIYMYVLLHVVCVMLWNFLSMSDARNYYYQPFSRSRTQYTRQENDYYTMDILMPGVKPSRPEEYLCYALAAPPRDSYIVSFEPRASMKTIHHMLVYGCTNIPNNEGVVDKCQGSPCLGKSNIMFGWARDAASPNIPQGVGFYVGGESGINYIMIQMHYGDKLDHLTGTSGDHSGISLTMTHTPQPFIGGIYLLWSGDINIPPHSKNTHVDIACKYDSSANIHPFAFRAHAHDRGKVITGYLIRNGEWTVIAKGSPKWPQAFYPIEESYTIQPGDILAARCTFDSDKDVATYAGATHDDEMCNLYLMYYTDATRGEAFQACGRPAPSSFFSSVPPGSNLIPVMKPDSQSEPHSRYRPAPVDPWDRYYDYDNQQDYDEGQQSYLQDGSNVDYVSPSLEDEDGGDEEIPLVTSKPVDIVPADSTPAAPSNSVTQPIISSKIQSFTVSDIDGWPSSDNEVTLGQVSGVAVDSSGNVHIFHRASRPWDIHSFQGDVFTQSNQGPIKNNTIIKYDSSTGKVLSQWGANQFYLPHGLSIDHEDNIWLTDVAMHQVFKYPPGGSETPLLTLGTKLEPGDDRQHFCKPSDVTVDPKTGNFFVSDGYCNARVMKFSPDGKLLLQWGHQLRGMPAGLPVGQFNLPHCITMVTDKNQVCVADREAGRIQCFNADSGDFTKQFHLSEFGGRLYAVTYTSASGGLLYAVNGPSNGLKPVKGFALNYTSTEILRMWEPHSQNFEKPHDIACTPDGKLVYVAEIGPNKVWKFTTNAEVLSFSVNSSETVLSTNETDTATVTEAGHMRNNTGNSTTYQPVTGDGQLMNESVDTRVNGLSSDARLGTTTIIVAVLAVPILLMLLVAVAIRLHAQGHFRLKKRRNYKVSAGDKFSLGSLLHKRNGFSQVATEDSDPDAAQWSEESDIEEYSILNNTKRTQNL
ncbi:peptidyl-glycine alpha-amidating monooxygenase B-like isoform X1 [Lytechinus pictus]|uniref:peptidyl-glycine alpha-amidating monooxygenase B-like isoform X1 n=1 Tax=Lytechinus pictus TaxID=7653 RepID=UPI0030BA0A5F